ncbi:MAG TPA: hypothetical protein VF148_12845 [Acidimicrobiia bacterium]
MHGEEYEATDDQPQAASEQEPDIDYDTDQIDVRDETEQGEPLDGVAPDVEARMIDNADLDNVLDEFVDLVNGRDLDGLSDLLASDAEADFLGETSREGVVDGFSDLFMRNPTLLMTRGDLGPEPIVAVWAFDFEGDRFDLSGYMTLDIGDSEDALIVRISYVDELSDTEDLVVETPDRSELPEWEDWSELDED